MKIKVWYDVNTGSGSMGVVEECEIIECSAFNWGKDLTLFSKGEVKKHFNSFNRFEVLGE